MEPVVLYFALVLTRVAAFVAVMPLFSGRGLPRLIRAGLAFALGVFWFGSLAPLGSDGAGAENLARLHLPGELPWLVFGLAILREAVLGVAIGFLFNLILAPVRIAGTFVSQQVGLAEAAVLGPAADHTGGPLTLILETLASLIFLELNGHHLVLVVLHASFARHPLGGPFVPPPTHPWIEAVLVAERLGVLLAGPLVLALFLVTVILALMARAAPQLNIYSVGFTIQALVALIAAYFLLPDLVQMMAAVQVRLFDLVRTLAS